ncbi:MAG: nucleotide sugar dehydrogenase [Methanomassiliicoccales archaeon]|nr:MAG: nucleotide sugar dehydrogenase [Methanomassiliicoccales archaeon]
MNRKICILGLGYVGLPTASMFATHGYDVVGVDVNEDIVKNMEKGNIPIKEPGLETLVLAALKSNRLKVQAKPEKADVFIICVPTPINEATKEPDLSYVKSATESILPYLEKGNLVVLESTVPPLTTQNIVIPILKKSDLKVGEEISVAYCPERVLPGKILTEFVKNDRIIGGLDKKSAQMAKELYGSFVEGNLHLTEITCAEMVKLMENTFRDVNIALANEFMKISERIGIDVWEAIILANKHPRVDIHRPGPGVGGHCIAVDPWFIINTDVEDTNLIKSARKTNDEMPGYVAGIVENELKDIEKPVVTVFGVAYKGNFRDTRQSPAKEVISILLDIGFEVRAYDPLVEDFPYELMPLDKALDGSDCILILANHRLFNNLDTKTIFSLMRNKKIIDTMNSLSSNWIENGFSVRKLGNG